MDVGATACHCHTLKRLTARRFQHRDCLGPAPTRSETLKNRLSQMARWTCPRWCSFRRRPTHPAL